MSFTGKYSLARASTINNLRYFMYVKYILLFILVIALCAIVAAVFSAWRWQNKSVQYRATLTASQQLITPANYNAQVLEGVPAPVQKYLRSVLKDGQPKLKSGQISTEGTFLLDAEKNKWVPFTATQLFTANPPAFDWSARMPMMPGMNVYVQDAYAKGEGVLHAALFGLIDLVNLRGTADVAQGELMRYLAEAVWMPTVLLPSQNLHWEAIDDTKARATLTDGAVSVSIEFRFNAEGFVESIFSPARSRTVGKDLVPTPWQGRFWNYQIRDGMRVPAEGEIAWLLPTGSQPYWRGKVTNIEYAFAH
jgi:hypothetical protein